MRSLNSGIFYICHHSYFILCVFLMDVQEGKRGPSTFLQDG